MPEVSYDSRSFLIDGRRIWLVSGSIPYARTPRGLWRERIRAAKQAGLNCIQTPVFWSAHEREPGVLDFEGELDLRHFVELISEAGMYCVLGAGPYVGSGWDMGGLPGYLHGIEDRKGNRVKFRENEPQFMEAVARFTRAMMKQVADLQVTSPIGGPIVLMQTEHAWQSSNPDQGMKYLERLVSMLRQQGCKVPIVNTNNLWQPVEGTIDTWSGASDLPAMTRQLAMVQPKAPALMMSFGPDSDAPRSGSKLAEPIDAGTQAYRLAGLIGVGAQFNIAPFHAGTSLGFTGGRTHEDDVALTAPPNADRAVLGEDGHRGEHYAATKRLCTFASHFGHVLAASDNTPVPSVALSEHDHPLALLSQSGSQGEMVMLLKSAKDKTKHTELMLSNGLTLDIPHAGQRAAWTLINASLGGIATLDYSSLSPWALIDRKLLVVFGPAGAEGVVSVDGQHHTVTVPTAKTPTVIAGDPVHIVVLSHEQIDAATIGPAGLVIGCDGLDADDKPIVLNGWGTQFTVDPDGQVNKSRVSPTKTASAPKLGKWQALSIKSLIEGSDERYESIAGPASLGALGQGFGYGWYRIPVAKSVSGKLLTADYSDRLHLYQAGKLSAILGPGEGANKRPTALKLNGDLVVLADNLGRYCEGQEIGRDPKGMTSHLYDVKPIKPGKPERIKQPAGDPFAVVGMALGQRAGVRTMSEAIAWTIKPEPRKPIIIEFNDLPQPCVLSINDEPIRYLAGEAHQPGRVRLILDPADDGPLTGGKNAIKLELLSPIDELSEVTDHVAFYQTTGQATPDDGWAFTAWTIPAGDDPDWRPIPKSLPSQPTWLGCTFQVDGTDAPLWFDPTGLSKGQIVLNGHNLGRYWVQTREGKQVAPDQRVYLPEPWLNTDGPNELMIFDEHGRTAEKCKLVNANQG